MADSNSGWWCTDLADIMKLPEQDYRFAELLRRIDPTAATEFLQNMERIEADHQRRMRKIDEDYRKGVRRLGWKFGSLLCLVVSLYVVFMVWIYA